MHYTYLQTYMYIDCHDIVVYVYTYVHTYLLSSMCINTTSMALVTHADHAFNLCLLSSNELCFSLCHLLVRAKDKTYFYVCLVYAHTCTCIQYQEYINTYVHTLSMCVCFNISKICTFNVFLINTIRCW